MKCTRIVYVYALRIHKRMSCTQLYNYIETHLAKNAINYAHYVGLPSVQRFMICVLRL